MTEQGKGPEERPASAEELNILKQSGMLKIIDEIIAKGGDKIKQQEEIKNTVEEFDKKYTGKLKDLIGKDISFNDNTITVKEDKDELTNKNELMRQGIIADIKNDLGPTYSDCLTNLTITVNGNTVSGTMNGGKPISLDLNGIKSESISYNLLKNTGLGQQIENQLPKTEKGKMFFNTIAMLEQYGLVAPSIKQNGRIINANSDASKQDIVITDKEIIVKTDLMKRYGYEGGKELKIPINSLQGKESMDRFMVYMSPGSATEDQKETIKSEEIVDKENNKVSGDEILKIMLGDKSDPAKMKLVEGKFREKMGSTVTDLSWNMKLNDGNSSQKIFSSIINKIKEGGTAGEDSNGLEKKVKDDINVFASKMGESLDTFIKKQDLSILYACLSNDTQAIIAKQLLGKTN